jgi:hypothetical protein
MSANYTPGNIATYNPTSAANYNAGAATYNPPTPGTGVNWNSTTYYEVDKKVSAPGQPLEYSTFSTTNFDSGYSLTCPVGESNFVTNSYNPGNIATYNPGNANYFAGVAVYNPPSGGVTWNSTTSYEVEKKISAPGEPLEYSTFVYNETYGSGFSPICPSPEGNVENNGAQIISYNVAYECTPFGEPGNLAGYEGNIAEFNNSTVATYNPGSPSGEGALYEVNYTCSPAGATPGNLTGNFAGNTIAAYNPGTAATYNAPTLNGGAVYTPGNIASYNPTNAASYNSGNATFTPGNLIPGGGNTQNYNPGSAASYNPPNIVSYFGNTAVPGNSNISGYTGNNVATYSGVTANYNIGAAASYNTPSIAGYNNPTGLSNPNYNAGNPATYTGNFVSAYNTGSAASYNTGNVGGYNAGVAASYNTGVPGGYNEGVASAYTGNNATFSPGNVANYINNNVATFNSAGNQTFNPGNPSGFTSNFVASYNSGTQNYNPPSITSYNPTNVASYNEPTISGYNAPSGGGGGCCFSGDTLITMADQSTKPISMIEVGDQILSYNLDTQEVETNEVNEIITRVNRVMFEYILQNGITLKASDDHPLFVVGKGFSSMNPELTKQGYKSLSDVSMIAAGDKLVDKNGNAIEINAIVPIDYPHIVYTINNRYKSSPTFFANGVLTY